MTASTTNSKKEKVTVSIDAQLVSLVDRFVEETKQSGVSRSSIFEQALLLWKQNLQDSYDAHYYTKNAKLLEDDSWSTIASEAARHIWTDS